MEPRIWPNHWAQAIWGTNYYRFVLWVEGDEAVLRTALKVKYTLHPTFDPGEIETDDGKSHFRVDGQAWGSFYAKIRIYYESGISEETPYFLDLKQVFQRKGPPIAKKCPVAR